MTMEQLSADTVKIELAAEELSMLDTAAREHADDPTQQLLLFLIQRAEVFSGIPFCSRQVTAELLPTVENGMIVYLTAQPPKPKTNHTRAAAVFADAHTLKDCCRALQPYVSTQTRSSLYDTARGKLLVLSHLMQQHRAAEHLLREYATLQPVTRCTLAQLEEYGHCIFKRDAIAAILGDS
ncbi:MAG: adaptor protein MecA [Oscillospiraceae bacterium]|nr:adaptor protein MecA [Oscillospiraceae bacterium]